MTAFTKLKLRFTLLSTLLTGVVLLAAFVFAYQGYTQQINTTHNEAFEARFSELENQLRNNRTISEMQVYGFEAGNGVLVQLYDNGQPIHFNTPALFAEQGLLLEMAEQQADPWLPYEETQRYFTVDHKAAEYRGKYAAIPDGYGNWYGLLMLKPLADLQAELQRARLLYAGVFFGALLLLAAAGALLAALAVRPARRAQRQQVEFTAAASHELKSPLAVLQSSAEMLAKDPARQTEYLANITGETKRMARLVDDLLLLTGADADRLSLHSKPLDTETLLLATLDRFLPLAAPKGQRLELELPTNALPPVMGDAERVVQLFSILLSNAFEYSPPESRIIIRAEPRRQEVAFSVMDHGPGIPDAEKKKVFARFYRGDGSHTDKNHYGLGLNIAQELAALHGGRLRVTDTPGGGATFSFTLPVAP